LTVGKKLTIAYIANANWVHGQRFARFFAERGHRVVFISFKPAELPGIEVHTLRPRHLGVADWFTTTHIARHYLAELRPDVAHYHFAPSYAFLASLMNYHPNVVTVHGTDVMSSAKEIGLTPLYTLFMMPFVVASLRKADVVTSVAGHLTGLMEAYGVSRKRIVTFQYGLELERYACQPRHNHGHIVLSTRNYFNYYRLDVLIKAAALVLAQRQDVTFLFAGEGPLRGKLEKQIAQLGISGHCRLLGKVTSEAIVDLCGRSAIYASSSAIDGTSLSLLEAMATGLYPVVSDIAANRWWIKAGEGGTLVASQEPQAWAQAITEALDDEERRQRALAVNRARVERDADWQANMLRMEDIYYELAERKRGIFS
jgi:glycosyltransferase involved in cell wall biosynthesis